jgi:hypothetical protein
MYYLSRPELGHRIMTICPLVLVWWPLLLCSRLVCSQSLTSAACSPDTAANNQGIGSMTYQCCENGESRLTESNSRWQSYLFHVRYRKLKYSLCRPWAFKLREQNCAVVSPLTKPFLQ